MTAPRRKILIDTDTASDDAVALIMALRSALVEVAAITVVAGNVDVRQATLNALYTVELCGSEVPVYTGAATPLLRTLENAHWFHGRDGLGDHGYAPEHRTAEPTHAVDAIIDTISANPEIDVITLGPLTNLALALRREPGIVKTSPAASSWAERHAARATSLPRPSSISGSTPRPPASSSAPASPSR